MDVQPFTAKEKNIFLFRMKTWSVLSDFPTAKLQCVPWELNPVPLVPRDIISKYAVFQFAVIRGMEKIFEALKALEVLFQLSTKNILLLLHSF